VTAAARPRVAVSMQNCSTAEAEFDYVLPLLQSDSGSFALHIADGGRRPTPTEAKLYACGA
jgi:hypothetical protein